MNRHFGSQVQINSHKTTSIHQPSPLLLASKHPVEILGISDRLRLPVCEKLLLELCGLWQGTIQNYRAP